jgi:hypothetical protein
VCGVSPVFFITKLVEKNQGKDHYLKLLDWFTTYLGKDQSPLDYDIIMCLRHIMPGHWFSYAMFPKGCQTSGFDSMGDNHLFKSDIETLHGGG